MNNIASPIADIPGYLSWITLSHQHLGLSRGHRKYLNIEEFVNENGKAMPVHKYPSNLLENRGRANECFYNAFNLVGKTERLVYCEGYAHSGMIPTLHAWAMDEGGYVLDPTWEDQQDCRYFGVAFNYQFVIDTALSRGAYGVIDNMENGFPLLEGIHPRKDYAYAHR